MADDTTRSLQRSLASLDERRVWTLRVVRAGDAPPRVRLHVVASGSRALGRAPDEGGIRIDGDPALSRTHARLECVGDSLVLHDASRNGTWVDGRRHVGPAALRDGAVIRMADTLLVARRRRPDVDDEPVDELIGPSPQLGAIRSVVAQLAGTNTSLVVTGATGTGKGQVAKALHRQRARDGAFVHLNCAAIPEQLAESMLFGHVAGAFTGASTPSPGAFRQADRGTVFLDEIDSMPLGLQAKLLVALDEAEVLPVGSSRPVRVDVRVVSAAHTPLSECVAAGRVRDDLWARLAGREVHIAPLRDRPEDVMPLWEAAGGPPAHLLPADVVQSLLVHDWRLNARAVQAAASRWQSEGTTGLAATEPADGVDSAPSPEVPPGADGPPSREELDALLRQHQGVVAAVARARKRTTKQVYRWMQRHGLEPDDYR